MIGSYDEKIIKGETVTISDKAYNTLLDILVNSDFESIQFNIDNILFVDGNSTYITVIDSNGFRSVGGHCAENSDERFEFIMDYILDLWVEL